MDKHLEYDNKKTSYFEACVLPHLDAAYNLARWLTRNDQDAEDLVQMAFVRAFRFFNGFRGGDARAWLLTIVRHTYFTLLRDNKHESDDVCFDEILHSEQGHADEASSYSIGSNPETILANQDAKRIVNLALEKLPQAFREIVVLKELENLSYKEIADIVGIPIGTVMSRLARGRKLLIASLQEYAIGGTNGL